eukprot:1156350-Pelagomonas_calceolata.AAC.6
MQKFEEALRDQGQGQSRMACGQRIDGWSLKGSRQRKEHNGLQTEDGCTEIERVRAKDECRSIEGSGQRIEHRGLQAEDGWVEHERVREKNICRSAKGAAIMTPVEERRCLQGAPELLEGYGVMIVSDQEHGPCMLKCEGCGEVMSPNHLADMQAAQLFTQVPLQGKGDDSLDIGEVGPSRFVAWGAKLLPHPF